MPAIITDQFRTNLAKNFITDVGENSYYTFVGFTDPTNPVIGGTVNWETNTPVPIDNFEQFDRYFDTIMTYAKVSTNDCASVLRNITWAQNTAYDMYRNNYSRNNLTPVTRKTNLFESNFYIINSQFRVYICLSNGAGWDFATGTYQSSKSSQIEPVFTGVLPQTLDDGYTWKYLYTLTPSQVLNLYSSEYIPIPPDWGTPSQVNDLNIYQSAVDGAIAQVILNNPGTDYPVSSTFLVPIRGDGNDGQVQIQTDSAGQIVSVILSNEGQNYTVGYIDLDYEASIPHPSGTKAEFEVIISPPGGIGFDLIEQLGGYRVLVHSKFENNENNPDLPVENQFARVGIIRNPTSFGSASNIFTNVSGSGLYGAKLTGFTTETVYNLNSTISQTISAGTTAFGLVVSWDSDTGILRYSQPVGLSTSASEYVVNRFNSSVGVGGTITINGQSSGPALNIDTAFNGNTVQLNNQIIDLGVNYSSGLANPDVAFYQGEIIYVDNRSSLSLNPNQREDIKIIIEF